MNKIVTWVTVSQLSHEFSCLLSQFLVISRKIWVKRRLIKDSYLYYMTACVTYFYEFQHCDHYYGHTCCEERIMLQNEHILPSDFVVKQHCKIYLHCHAPGYYPSCRTHRKKYMPETARSHFRLPSILNKRLPSVLSDIGRTIDSRGIVGE